MKLTFLNRIKICWETLTIRSGHAHTAQEKQLSVFQRGYHAGLKDCEHEPLNNVVEHGQPRCKDESWCCEFRRGVCSGPNCPAYTAAG
jgi:hypothetical protein